MHIYIDESGNFAQPPQGVHSYACAGALTIPDRHHDDVISAFDTLKAAWGLSCSEPKGRSLGEEHIAQVVDILLHHGARFHVCLTDMYYNDARAIQVFKTAQAAQLIANITKEHQLSFVEDLNSIKARLVVLPDQLFVQLIVMTELVAVHLRDTLLYYAVFDPPELGQFNWVIDQKDRKRTEYEDLWRFLLPGFVHGIQFNEGNDSRIVFLDEGDYSHFEKYCHKIAKWPGHLPRTSTSPRGNGPISMVDIGIVLREFFTVTDSSTSPGLQLADIVTNAFRRAISGRLDRRGWGTIGRLMFQCRGVAVRMAHLAQDLPAHIPIMEEPARSVVSELTRQARTPLANHV